MEWIRVAVGARRRLWLLLGVVAVALSLLAMHQLSSNHTAAGPTEAVAVVATDAAHQTLTTHADTHAADSSASGHAHLSGSFGDGHPFTEGGGCPGCADHSAMALTCLAALVLLIGGWMLARPRRGRGLWLRQLLPPRLTIDLRSWVPRPRSLAELAVSRT